MKTSVTFLASLAQFFLEGEMFRTKFVEYIQTHILFSITVLENRAFYKIIWKNIVERGMPQLTIWRMRIACWTNNTNSEYNTYSFFHCNNSCTNALTVTLSAHWQSSSYTVELIYDHHLILYKNPQR